MLKEKIEKVIEINGVYHVTFSLPYLHRYGNFLSGRGHICVSRYKRGIRIDVFNTNQYGRVYADHGEYTFFLNNNGNIIKKTDDGIIPAKIQLWESREVFAGTLPVGWRVSNPDTEEGYRKLIEICKTFGAQVEICKTFRA